MEKRMIIAGFGGQGVLSLGVIISELALKKGLNVSWIPSYGAEMRGGTANCSVVYADNMIGSPVVNDEADIVIVMNNPSLEKFESKVRSGGVIILDSSVVSKEVTRSDVQVFKVEATDFANKLGSSKVANMVVLGEFIRSVQDFTMQDAENVIKEKFASKTTLVPLNLRAIELK